MFTSLLRRMTGHTQSGNFTKELTKLEVEEKEVEQMRAAGAISLGDAVFFHQNSDGSFSPKIQFRNPWKNEFNYTSK